MPETNVLDSSVLDAPTNVLAGAPISEPTPEEPPKDVTPDEPVVVQPPVGEPVGNVAVESDRLAQERTDENLVRLEEETAKLEAPEAQPVAVGGVGVFRDPATNQLQQFSNVDINAENIIGRGLEFVSGRDISPEIRRIQEAKVVVSLQMNLLNLEP